MIPEEAQAGLREYKFPGCLRLVPGPAGQLDYAHAHWVPDPGSGGPRIFFWLLLFAHHFPAPEFIWSRGRK